ncbi:MAG: leucine-rich repeat domain-containing protein [Phycisphaerales bacterium]
MVGGALAEDPVYFADPLLKAAVERDLWVTDPTPSDMLALTELDCVGDWDAEEDDLITSLTGLEYATNLRTLNLRFNLISDISALSRLTNLTSVNLSQNQISDVSPLSGHNNLTYVNLHANSISDASPLSGLTNATTLILRFNGLSDISPLSGMKSLRELDLGENQISDLSPLSSLTSLSTLCLWSNQISDLSALSGLANLTTLDADMNYISDVSPLSGLSRLRSLDLESNTISDISPLCSMTSLSFLDLEENPLPQEAYDTYIPQIIANNPGISIQCDHIEYQLTLSSRRGGSVIAPGEGGYFYDNGANVWIEAKADPGFLFAGWSGTCPSTENPLLLTMNQSHRMEANFVRPLDILHVNDGTSADPDEDGTAEHPFNRIQEAVEVAGEGVTVIVHPGTYRESVDLPRKNLRLIGKDPNDTTPGPWPIIEGTGLGPAIRFCGGQTTDCIVTGFVITRSSGQTAGAIYCEGACPLISNCLIVGNRTTFLQGAAVYCKNSEAVLTSCTIADNYASQQGAGLHLVNSNVTVLNSILWNNRPNEILSTGTSKPDIRCCTIRGGWTGDGNSDEDPLFASPGSWVNPNDPTMVLDAGISWAVWSEGDYHLPSEAGRWDPTAQDWVQDAVTSPCVDAGLADVPVGNEPAPNGGRINLGAYGGTAEASMSPGEF